MNRLVAIVTAINFILVSLIIAFYFSKSDEKLVYVNSAKLLNEFKGMQDARKGYQIKLNGWKANVDTLTQELQSSLLKYEKEMSRMTPKEKTVTEELLRTKQKQLGDFQQAMQARAKQEDSQMTTQVITQVNAYLKKYGKQKGYRIILAATDYGNIAYASDDLDITEQVLAGLNAEYEGK